jgi:hypothetical protein
MRIVDNFTPPPNLGPIVCFIKDSTIFFPSKLVSIDSASHNLVVSGVPVLRLEKSSLSTSDLRRENIGSCSSSFLSSGTIDLLS